MFNCCSGEAAASVPNALTFFELTALTPSAVAFTVSIFTSLF
jgi:hypothetical protein